MSLNETCSKTGEANTSDPLHSQNSLKPVGLVVFIMFQPFFFLMCHYEDPRKQVELKLNGTRQPLVYTDGVNLLVENINT